MIKVAGCWLSCWLPLLVAGVEVSHGACHQCDLRDTARLSEWGRCASRIRQVRGIFCGCIPAIITWSLCHFWVIHLRFCHHMYLSANGILHLISPILFSPQGLHLWSPNSPKTRLQLLKSPRNGVRFWHGRLADISTFPIFERVKIKKTNQPSKWFECITNSYVNSGQLHKLSSNVFESFPTISNEVLFARVVGPHLLPSDW